MKLALPFLLCIICGVLVAQTGSEHGIINSKYILCSGYSNVVILKAQPTDSVVFLPGTVTHINGSEYTVYIPPYIGLTICQITFWNNGSLLKTDYIPIGPIAGQLRLNGPTAADTMDSKAFQQSVFVKAWLNYDLYSINADIVFTIAAFDLVRITQTETKEVHVAGAILFEESRAMVQNAKPGDIFIFKNIQATTADGLIANVADKAITIK